MKEIFFIITILIGLNLSAMASADNSNITKNLDYCYKWVTNKELKQWQQNGPSFKKIERMNHNYSSAIFCWSNPVGGFKGDQKTWYGNNLIRIDLNENSLMYDSVLNKYYSTGTGYEVFPFVPSKQKSPIVYNNYNKNGKPWFQEYLIQNNSIIKKVTTNFEDLRDELEKELTRLNSGDLTAKEMHYYRNRTKAGPYKLYKKLLNENFLKISAKN